jgi:hypothetical protein
MDAQPVIVDAPQDPPRRDRTRQGVLKHINDFLDRGVNALVGSIAELALLCVGLAGIAIVAVHTAIAPPQEWPQATLIILLPFALSYTSFLSAKGRINRLRFDLHQPPASPDPSVQRILTSVHESWAYERRRFRSALAKTGTHALVFGLTTTLVLALGFVVYQQSVNAFPKPWLFEKGASTLSAEMMSFRMRALVAVACASAAIAGFLLSFARILVRLANQDFNARMYSWACRATFFVLVATVVATTLLARSRGSTPLIEYPHEAVLLGATIAVFGSSVLELIANKAAGVFGLNTESTRRASDLLNIEGLTPDDIERLAEEGVDSLHALAFVPTARLFFGTNHSLQRLVDWQDQALLHVYVGQTRAVALKDKLLIRGAIDLWGAVQGLDPAVATPRRDALGQALGLTDGQLVTFIETIRDDQVTRRIHAHWRATARISGGGSARPPPVAVEEAVLKHALDASLSEAMARNPAQVDAAEVKRVVDQSLREASARAHRRQRLPKA